MSTNCIECGAKDGRTGTDLRCDACREKIRKSIDAIKQELNDHSECIGADDREPDRLQRDAELIHMHRHGGITVETMCMMMTDLQFGLAARRKEIDGLRKALQQMLDADVCENCADGWCEQPMCECRCHRETASARDAATAALRGQSETSDVKG